MYENLISSQLHRTGELHKRSREPNGQCRINNSGTQTTLDTLRNTEDEDMKTKKTQKKQTHKTERKKGEQQGPHK